MTAPGYATHLLLDAIEHPDNTRDDVAQRYAWGLQQAEVHWDVVNAAIVARWSKSALSYVKRKAWAVSPGPPA